MEKIKRIDIKEFKEKGYLQELNRKFLHPLGLALEVVIDDEKNVKLGGIWDYREDEEGLYYNIGKKYDKTDMRMEKFINNKNFIDEELKNRSVIRKEKLGFITEPIPGSPEVLDIKLIALLAEYENYKKRSLKEKIEVVNKKKVQLLTAILDMDNDLAIAMKQVKNKEALEGLKLILNKLSKFLKDQGIEEIQTDEYDSDLHDVINFIDGDGISKIINVVDKGYSIDGKPFRYPKVVLSKK